MRLSPWTACLSLALLAGCPKKHEPVEPTPDPVDPGPGAGKIAAPHINDPEIRCHDPEEGRTVFMIEWEHPEGCGYIMNEVGDPENDLEITVQASPSTAFVMEPVDLAMRAVAYVQDGCGLKVAFAGAIGTLDLEVAATVGPYSDIAGTAHWAAADGTECDLVVTGRYNRYDRRD